MTGSKHGKRSHAVWNGKHSWRHFLLPYGLWKLQSLQSFFPPTICHIVNPFNPPRDKVPWISVCVGWQFTFQSHHNDSLSLLQTSHPMVIWQVKKRLCPNTYTKVKFTRLCFQVVCYLCGLRFVVISGFQIDVKKQLAGYKKFKLFDVGCGKYFSNK